MFYNNGRNFYSECTLLSVGGKLRANGANVCLGLFLCRASGRKKWTYLRDTLVCRKFKVIMRWKSWSLRAIILLPEVNFHDDRNSLCSATIFCTKNTTILIYLRNFLFAHFFYPRVIWSTLWCVYNVRLCMMWQLCLPIIITYNVEVKCRDTILLHRWKLKIDWVGFM